ncbi:zinc metallopeptidase [Anaerococcus hydrogenalis]|uniref:Peptidase n=2 Tax=Anaerococcus hydrogenalis TaxID=33029 RepID=A0A2N6UI46_9FIRM|nr:zinc metallopeptidase [Anaerococcus hydrogenalis]EEB35881.1 putative neutral zinc metallopeptidase [Anaerococcus hydrogenalis DSM 7454]MDK7695290.1 zinc metallopeptidase [Anaerococcus hydrogenalis]MDK7697049.1 zinc metallopeptidase [Anaerococcus hydrogenalis]MDK7708430.1 zinc metallopeptidase [Anaerococcus hydrogenalis]PMC81252.1 peptidase [Anaerococcus hydrogenalis]
MFYFDRTYVLVLIGLLISSLAQTNIQRKFDKYKKIKTQKSITGFDAARYILSTNSYNDISIKKVRGSLSDYFNPVSKEVALSETSMTDTSIASLAVAAHECGHVIQYKEGYIPLKIKSYIVPAVNLGSKLSFPMILLGIFLSMGKLITIGIFLFSFVLIFQIITLPVEFDASRRALKVLKESGMLVGVENDYAKDMLKSAALTYVAATISTALQFLRLWILFGNRRDD